MDPKLKYKPKAHYEKGTEGVCLKLHKERRVGLCATVTLGFLRLENTGFGFLHAVS